MTRTRGKHIKQINDQNLIDLLKSIGDSIVAMASNDEKMQGFYATAFDSKSRLFRIDVYLTRDTLDVGTPVKILYD